MITALAALEQAAKIPPQERRKDPGNDLILRNLTTGQDVTIPEVTEYAWDKTGASLVYAVSSTGEVHSYEPTGTQRWSTDLKTRVVAIEYMGTAAMARLEAVHFSPA